jgi:succinyl-CoA synthetase beta subunit
MDLLEYQAKELFNEIGIPILPSQPIEDPAELKRLQIPYPVVLKSQVRAGGRGRAGGVRMVENTIDAIAAARAIFHLPIMGEYPEVVLVEAHYNTQQEIFLAVLLDYQLQRPVLLGSVKGGIDIETLIQHMERVVIDEEFSPFHARKLAIKMGLQGALIQKVSTIVEKMYHLFCEKDLDLVEINPLGVSADGEVMALDGKISVNDNALGRHPDLIVLTTSKKQASDASEGESFSPSESLKPRQINGIDYKGNVGIISNSVGLGLATWDLIALEKAKPAYCLVIGDGVPRDSLIQQLELALEQMMSIRNLKVVLVNILCHPLTTQLIVEAIANFLQPEDKQVKGMGEERILRATGHISTVREKKSLEGTESIPYSLPWVIRVVGGDLDPIKERLSELPIPIHWTETLEDSITQTLTYAKSK